MKIKDIRTRVVEWRGRTVPLPPHFCTNPMDLLALPEALDWYLAKVLPAQRRLARGARPFAALLGRSEALPADAVFGALLSLRDDLAATRRLLADPATTTVRLVLTPESVVVAEARRTFTALALYGYRVDLVVANRVFPTGRDGFRQGWVEAQRAELRTLSESFAGLPIRTVAYAPAEPVGAVALRAVAGELYGADDPGELSAPVRLMRVEPDGEQFRLRLWLPLARRDDIAATRVGDELMITVAGHRRVLALPSVLRRCEVVGARFDVDELVVQFRPDPALWPRTQEEEIPDE